MPSRASKPVSQRTATVLLWTVFLFVVPAMIVAMFGLLVYPAIFDVMRNWF